MSAPAADWATDKAVELVSDVHTRSFNEALNAIAVALRNERANGYAEALTFRAELKQYAIGLGQRTRLAPRDVRQRLYDLRRTIRDFDTQSDHDVERTESWAVGEGAL